MAEFVLNLNLNQEAALREALELLLTKRQEAQRSRWPAETVEEILQQLNDRSIPYPGHRVRSGTS